MSGYQGADELLSLIDSLLAGRLTVPAFERQYYRKYLELDNAGRSEAEEVLLSDVHEKLDWTTEDPDSPSRADGWIDHQEFIAWLRDRHSTWLSAK